MTAAAAIVLILAFLAALMTAMQGFHLQLKSETEFHESLLEGQRVIHEIEERLRLAPEKGQKSSTGAPTVQAPSGPRPSLNIEQQASALKQMIESGKRG